MSEENKVVTVSAEAVRDSLDPAPVANGAEGPEEYLPAIRRGASISVDTGSGVVDITGVLPPFVQIVQKTSGLVNEGFSIGAWVLNKEHLVADKDVPFRAIVLKFEQFVKEGVTNDQWQMGIRPRVFKNKEEAAAAGLRIEWGPKKEKPEADYALDMIVLIEKPDSVTSGMFGIKVGAKDYALARASFDKMSYRSAADTFLQSVAYALRNIALTTAVWELKSKLYTSKSKQSNTAYVPSFSLKEFLTESAHAELKAVFGSFLARPIPKEAAEAPAF